MGPAVVIGRTMTILSSGDGLVVLNAVRLNEAGQADLDRLGKVRHLVKLSDSHGVDEPYYQDRYRPDVWSLRGARLGGLTLARTFDGEGPVPGGAVIDYAGTAGWREAAYFVPLGGGTLITCDAIQNCADKDRASFLGGVTIGLMGFTGGVIVPSMWRKFQKVRGPKVRETLAPLVERPFGNLVTGHGPPLAGGADALVRSAIDAAAS